MLLHFVALNGTIDTLPDHCWEKNYRHGRTADRDLRQRRSSRLRVGNASSGTPELTGFAIKIFAPTRANPKGARTFVLSYWINGSERRYRIGSPGRTGR